MAREDLLRGIGTQFDKIQLPTLTDLDREDVAAHYCMADKQQQPMQPEEYMHMCLGIDTNRQLKYCRSEADSASRGEKRNDSGSMSRRTASQRSSTPRTRLRSEMRAPARTTIRLGVLNGQGSRDQQQARHQDLRAGNFSMKHDSLKMKDKLDRWRQPYITQPQGDLESNHSGWSNSAIAAMSALGLGASTH